MSDSLGATIEQLVKQLKSKDFLSLARLLTTLEREGVSCLSNPDLLSPAGKSFRLGITGPPGAGKSTLIGQLIQRFTKQGLSVGVIAVDPSSPFSHGAILGDRIRYTDYLSDNDVFVRSLGSRGSLGGLSASAYLMLRAYDVFGFDIVLLETVGVGQTELEVMNVADMVSVVLVPESGDSVQAMKAGLLEIADLFVVNKADRPGADGLARELEASVSLGQKAVSVLKTKALEGDGVEALIAKVEEFKASQPWQIERTSAGRLQAEAKALLRMQAESEVSQRVAGVDRIEAFRTVLGV